jgi:hypothetical protein
MHKVFFFTKECNTTSRIEKAYYRVEIDNKKRASFYKKGFLSTPFYIAKIDNVDDDKHLKSYLKILLRAKVMVLEN